jgi:hypothetical protein
VLVDEVRTMHAERVIHVFGFDFTNSAPFQHSISQL